MLMEISFYFKKFEISNFLSANFVRTVIPDTGKVSDTLQTHEAIKFEIIGKLKSF